MRIAAILALSLILIVTGVEIARFMKQNGVLQREVSESTRQLTDAQKEAAALQANLNYFNRPENLEKEMRTRFNYRGAQEKLLILVPPLATSSSSTIP